MKRQRYVILADGRRVKPWVRSASGMSATAGAKHRRARMEKLLGPSERTSKD